MKRKGHKKAVVRQIIQRTAAFLQRKKYFLFFIGPRREFIEQNAVYANIDA